MASPRTSPPSPKDAWHQLRLIERRIQRRDIVRALKQLNAVAGDVADLGNPMVTALLRSIIGDAEFKQGRYPEAITAYGLVRAEYTIHKEGHLLLRGGIGEIRSLLKLSDLTTAMARAKALILVAQIPAPHFAPPADGSAMPVHTSVPTAAEVATRVSGYFRREGFGPESAALLAMIPAAADNEGTRRERAATLLRTGNASGAEFILSPMVLNPAGKDRPPPVKLYQMLMQARRLQKKPLLLPAEISAISKIKGNRQRARIGLVAVQGARMAGDPTWRTLLETLQLTKSPTPAEFRLTAARLLLTELKREGTDYKGMLTLADAILNNPKVTLDDYISGARASLFATLRSAAKPNPMPMVRVAQAKFGASARIKTIYSLARAAYQAKGYDLAVDLYQMVRREATPKTRRKVQSTSALAYLNFERKKFHEAAAFSAELVADVSLSPDFRLQALRMECSSLKKLGRTADLKKAQMKLDALLPGDLPPSTLIRMARFSRLATDIGNDNLTFEIMERAVVATLKAVFESPHPGPSLTLLLELNRKLFWDFRYYERVWSIWKKLGEERRDWLWSERSAFWEYISLVLRACGNLGHKNDAEELYAMTLRDAPSQAVPFVAVAMGDYLRESNRWAEAFETYQRAIQAHPTHIECGRAHYWLALLARREGRPAAAVAALEAVRRCFGSGVAQGWHYEVDTRARLMLNGMNEAAVAAASAYEMDFIKLQPAALKADEATLPSI